jgi:hypothetical protein
MGEGYGAPSVVTVVTVFAAIVVVTTIRNVPGGGSFAAGGESAMLLELLLTPVPSEAVATVQVLVNKDSRPFNLKTWLNRAIIYLMRKAKSDSANSVVYLWSLVRFPVDRACHKIWRWVKLRQLWDSTFPPSFPPAAPSLGTPFPPQGPLGRVPLLLR